MNAFTAGKTENQGRTIQRKDNSRILLKLKFTLNTHTYTHKHTHIQNKCNASSWVRRVNLITSIIWEKLNTIATLNIVWIILDII